jgi:hypothetical protein
LIQWQDVALLETDRLEATGRIPRVESGYVAARRGRFTQGLPLQESERPSRPLNRLEPAVLKRQAIWRDGVTTRPIRG